MMRIVLTPTFRSLLKKLGRKYRRAHRDVEALIAELERGQKPGVRLSGFGEWEVYKTRLPNSSAGIGKRGGFRVQYYVDENAVWLLLIWSKSQVDDLPDHITRQVIEEEVLS